MQTTVFTYTELKTRLASELRRASIAPSTLSNWMSALGYPKGRPGRKRQWDYEDLVYIAHYAWHVGRLGSGDAALAAAEKIEQIREEQSWQYQPSS